MTLEELKKLISKDETKNIELRFNPWVYGNDSHKYSWEMRVAMPW